MMNLIRRRQPDAPPEPRPVEPQPEPLRVPHWRTLTAEQFAAAEPRWVGQNAVRAAFASPDAHASGSAALAPGIYRVRTSSAIRVYREDGSETGINVSGCFRVGGRGKQAITFRFAKGFHLVEVVDHPTAADMEEPAGTASTAGGTYNPNTGKYE